ncbi:Cytochrome P450 [Rhypophila sp. PSN 637]
MHKTYGPVVRIAPNEVIFASSPAVKEIYCSSGSGYDKTEFYNLFTPFNTRTMFSTLTKDEHAKRKRILADRYANSNIMRSCLDGISERAGRFLNLASSKGTRLDLYIALHSYAFDCVTYHMFHPFGANSLEDKKDEDIMKEVTMDSSMQNRLVQYWNPTLHGILGKGLRLFGVKPRELPLANDFVWGNTTCNEKREAAPFTLVDRLRGAETMGNIEVAAECADHMAAGIDTTGDALCFLMWELSLERSRVYQDRLREEVLNNPGVSWDKLEFLDAVVMEGLRCFPAIPMSLPRYVPPGGRTIDGYFVPGATIVSCQAYSMHRIPEVFPDPDSFRPERWLEVEGDAERRRHFFAFANGGRGCVGKQ